MDNKCMAERNGEGPIVPGPNGAWYELHPRGGYKVIIPTQEEQKLEAEANAQRVYKKPGCLGMIVLALTTLIGINV